jgi:hypothetical protein
MIDITNKQTERSPQRLFFYRPASFSRRVEKMEGQYIYERYNTRGGIIIMIILVRTAQHSYAAFHALSNPVLEDV